MPRLSEATLAARAKEKARQDRAHDKYVQRTYGLEAGEYARLLEAQQGRCAICARVARNRRLAVDHNHETGQVRSLLCYFCNKYLGQWEGDPIAAHNASVYLAEIAATHGEAFRPSPAPVLEPPKAPRPLRLPRVVLDYDQSNDPVN